MQILKNVGVTQPLFLGREIFVTENETRLRRLSMLDLSLIRFCIEE